MQGIVVDGELGKVSTLKFGISDYLCKMRYTVEELRQMPEGQTFECKSVQVDPKVLANTIVGMANADGGVIAIGISDKTRKIEGIDQDKAHLNEILRTPFDFCVPTVSVSTQYISCPDASGNDNHILLMYVPASPRLHANCADEVFWRVGDKTRKLQFEERVQLMYDKGERYFEDSPAYDATIEDIDMDVVKAFTARIGYGKSALEYLQENKGFLSYKDGVQQVSIACILLFGKRPQNFFPRARVRFIKYLGTEEKVGREMNVVKDVTFEGRILDQIEKTVKYLETQVKEHSYLGENGTFVTDREYPKFVIQEMVVNSVCHRDYSIKGTEIQIKMFDDRIVFETPGKLPGIVRPDNIRNTHFSRNPKLAEYLKTYDYVKEFGEGVDRMCRELTALGTKELQYNLVAFIMKATVYAAKLKDEAEVAQSLQNGEETTQKTDKNYPENQQKTTQKTDKNYPENQCKTTQKTTKGQKTGKKITDTQRAILNYMGKNPKAGREEIASNICNITADGVKYNITVLQKKGLLRRIGSDKGGYWEIITNEKQD